MAKIQGFYEILLEVLRRLDLGTSETQIAANSIWGAKIPVSLGKSRKEVGDVIPHLVLVDGDEQLTPPESSYATAIGSISCTREVAVWCLIPRGDHVNHLNQFMDALIDDFETFRNIARVTAVEYEMGDRDYDSSDAGALRAVLFSFTYIRRSSPR